MNVNLAAVHNVMTYKTWLRAKCQVVSRHKIRQVRKMHKFVIMILSLRNNQHVQLRSMLFTAQLIKRVNPHQLYGTWTSQ